LSTLIIFAAFFGVIFSAVGAYLYDGDKIASRGLFQGFNKSVALVLFLQAYGGLLVASVVKYTDNLVKVFASSISLVISSCVSYFIFHDLQLTFLFTFGTFMVLSATFLYGFKPRPKSSYYNQVKSS